MTYFSDEQNEKLIFLVLLNKLRYSMDIILAIIIFILLGLCIYLQTSISSLKREAVRNEGLLRIDFGRAEERNKLLEQEKAFLLQQHSNDKRALELHLDNLRSELRELEISRERDRSSLLSQHQKIAEQKEEISSLHLKLNKDFELLANRILEEKSEKFSEANKANLDAILNPLKENIKAFEEKVDKVYRSEAAERNILQGELNKLMQLNKQISDEANNLSKALRADTKKQGNWGEIVLDRVLEASGLVAGESYSKQLSALNDDNVRLQPDVVVYLPGNKHLIVDSKVSLTAYNKLVNCNDEQERMQHMNDHLSSVKSHIKNLSSKNYSNLKGLESPDFVLLFMPLESAFSLAIQHDIELFEFAWNRKIVMVSPSTLLATLKTIASVWRHEQQTKNAIEIATRAGQLYDKFSAFVGDLKKVGEQLDKARDSYSDAYNKLSSGQGNLMSRAENLKKMGAKASKQLEHLE